MCTRYYVESWSDKLAPIIETAEKSPLISHFEESGYKIKMAGEIAPSLVVPAIASSRNGMKSVFPMRWGYKEKFSRTLIVNARIESALSKILFSDSMKSRRCIIPASWYYEWQHYTDENGKTKTGDKFKIKPVDESITWLCGIYRFEEELPVFTILTREPSEGLKGIHNRMPLIFHEDNIEKWIDPASDPSELIGQALTDVIIEKAKQETVS